MFAVCTGLQPDRGLSCGHQQHKRDYPSVDAVDEGADRICIKVLAVRPGSPIGTS